MAAKNTNWIYLRLRPLLFYLGYILIILICLFCFFYRHIGFLIMRMNYRKPYGMNTPTSYLPIKCSRMNSFYSQKENKNLWRQFTVEWRSTKTKCISRYVYGYACNRPSLFLWTRYFCMNNWFVFESRQSIIDRIKLM